MYDKVPTNLNFVEREVQTEQFWKEHDIFGKSIKAREGVRAVSDKEIKGEESFLGKSYVTPNKLFEDTKMLPNTDVLVDPGQKTKYEFKSVIKAVIKHAMKP